MLNEASQEEVSVRDVRILPNLNASYLPVMPDGSVLLVDNVWYVAGSRSVRSHVPCGSTPYVLCSHQSGEVGMASFCRVDSLACRLPSTLGALEEHDFLFQLHLNDTPPDDSSEVRPKPSKLHSNAYVDASSLVGDSLQGLEVPLVAVLQWSTPKMPFTNCIYTHYR